MIIPKESYTKDKALIISFQDGTSGFVNVPANLAVNVKKLDVGETGAVMLSSGELMFSNTGITISLNSSITASLKPSGNFNLFSLIDTLNFRTNGVGSLTITTGAKAKNWKLDLTVSSVAAGIGMYVGINAGINTNISTDYCTYLPYLNLGSASNITVSGNPDSGSPFTANISVNITGKTTGQMLRAIGTYATASISVNGDLTGKMDVKMVHDTAGADAYGFLSDGIAMMDETESTKCNYYSGELYFARSIKGKISVLAQTKSKTNSYATARAFVFSANNYGKITLYEQEDAPEIKGETLPIITIRGSIANSLTATAISAAGIAQATVFDTSRIKLNDKQETVSDLPGFTYIGAIRGALSASATAALYAESSIIYTGHLEVYDAITKNLTSTASGDVQAAAYGLRAEGVNTEQGLSGGLQFFGKFDGKVTVSATGKTGAATATALYSNGGAGIVFYSGITKDITAKANAGTDASARALSGTAINFAYDKTGIFAKITASAVSKNGSAQAFGMFSTDGIYLLGGNTAAISATASGKIADADDGSVSACAVAFGLSEFSEGKNHLNWGKVAGDISASATNSIGSAEAYAFLNSFANTPGIRNALFNGTVTKNITAKAVGATTAISGAIQAGMGVCFYKGVSGKITATANSKNGYAETYAITAGTQLVFYDDIANAITATATGKIANSPGEYGVIATAMKAGEQIILTDIAGAITATAANSAGSALARAFAIGPDKLPENPPEEEETVVTALSVFNISKNITVSAKATGISGDATAYGAGKSMLTFNENGFWDMQDMPVFQITGEIKSKITVTANSRNGTAIAYGAAFSKLFINQNSLNMGSITVNADGKEESSLAVGVHLQSVESLLGAPGTITGNLSVSCKNGTAVGAIIGMVSLKSCSEKILAVNLKVTGANAIGYQIGKDTALTDEETKAGFASVLDISGNVLVTSTDKNKNAIAIKGGSQTNETVQIRGGAKITGDIDLGKGGETEENSDVLYLHSGASVKGNISNVENCWFFLDDDSYASKPIFQGDFVKADNTVDLPTIIGISIGYGDTGTFTLFQTNTQDESTFANQQFGLLVNLNPLAFTRDKETGRLSCDYADYTYSIEFTETKKGTIAKLNIAEKQ